MNYFQYTSGETSKTDLQKIRKLPQFFTSNCIFFNISSLVSHHTAAAVKELVNCEAMKKAFNITKVMKSNIIVAVFFYWSKIFQIQKQRIQLCVSSLAARNSPSTKPNLPPGTTKKAAEAGW